MKKLMNSPDDFVDEMLDGLCAAHPPLVREGPGGRVIRAVHAPQQGKVGVVSGGGSGHLPLFTGYVGHGLLDACSIGDVFAGPSVDSCLLSIYAANGVSGVLLFFGNFSANKINLTPTSKMVYLNE